MTQTMNAEEFSPIGLSFHPVASAFVMTCLQSFGSHREVQGFKCLFQMKKANDEF